MTNTTSRLPLLHTVSALLVAAALIVGALLTGGTAAAAPVCGSDLDCAAYELGQAIARGETVREDLTFPSASALYGAKSELLADIFWSRIPAGTDWSEARLQLPCFVKAIRA